MRNSIKASLKVTVNAFDKILKGKATVYLQRSGGLEKAQAITLRYDIRFGYFTGQDILSGSYTLVAESKGYETQTRQVSLNSGEQDQQFILGVKGAPFYYRGEVKVPFQPLPDYLGIVLKETVELYNAKLLSSKRGRPTIVVLLKRFNLKEVKTHANFLRNGLVVVQFPAKTSEQKKMEIQEAIRDNNDVFLCAPILRLLDKNATLLTDNLIVKFKSNIIAGEVERSAKEYNLLLLRHIPYAGNAFQFQFNGPISYRILDICEALVQTGKVEYAEPDLWHTIEEDSITPTDWVFPEQWDHALLDTGDAWQALHDINVNRTFGDPGVIIAVFDSGIDAGHTAFSGTLTDGSSKVYQLFDFGSMVANNNATLTDPFGGHGTCCAGAASARANDPSTIAGVNEGTAGIAGNCKIIGVRRAGSETRYSDAYIWAAGFDPHSITAGFPAPISPGADIITNSFGISTYSPISGLMKDTFDYLTSYGRNGKGVLLFFSTGNYLPREDFTATNSRPWAAYSRTFAIGASTLNNDGVTEGPTTYSGYGTALDFCAPSQDDYIGGIAQHNPPTNYGAWTTARSGTGDVLGRPTTNTTLSANAASGANMITVGSVAGMAINQAILIGDPGSLGAEAKSITAINAVTNQITLGSRDIDGTSAPGSAALFNNHAIGTNVHASSGDYTNCMGGTSYATPITAGIAALMLSANPDLTWIDVRQIIRNTAVKIDAATNNVIDRWTDSSGRFATDPAYTGPFFSQGYGYGRIDAAAAVEGARDYVSNIDILVRDNLADSGSVPSIGTFWGSPDVWVRTNDPAIDGAAAFPASYASGPPHQDADRTHDNWVYIRMKNTGTAASNSFYVRLYIVHWPGTEFIFPNDFIPSNNPGTGITTPMVRGTYLIGESLVSSLGSGADSIINIKWDQAKIPPSSVMVGGSPADWHPCLLVQIAPQDGPLPSGNHVWDSNNLIQRNITIVGADSGDASDFAVAIVIGNAVNLNRLSEIEIDRGKLPKGIKLYVQVEDAKVMDWIEKNQKARKEKPKHPCYELMVLSDTEAVLLREDERSPVKINLSLTKNSRVTLCNCDHGQGPYGSFRISRYRGKKVLLLDDDQKTRIPILRAYNKTVPIVVGGIIESRPPNGTYDIAVNQFDHEDVLSGSYGIQLKF